MVNILNGASCLFWDDLWLGCVPRLAYPEHYSFAKRHNISVQKAREVAGPHELLQLPISNIAYHQLLELVQSLDSLPHTQEADF